MRRALSTLGAAVLVLTVAVGVSSSAGTAKAPHDKQTIAQQLLKKKEDRFMTASARAALAMAAAGDRKLTAKTLAPSKAKKNKGKGHARGKGLDNVRVNDPGADSHFVDQTTQSETAVGVSGKNVVVGFNDSQLTPLFLTAASNLSGYGYSTDGGKNFKDAGNLPNKPAFINLGDPWLATDRAGNFYYSTLAIDGMTGDLDVGVSKSTDGGKTFTAPVIASPSGNFFYFGDKEAVATGRDPSVASRDNVYAAWDDFFVDQDFNFFTGLPVARSTDGGQTWEVTYADKIGGDVTGCSFAQYIGAIPAVDGSGNLYVVAEKISVDDPDCTFPPLNFSEWIFKSTDGGQHFDSGRKIADVTQTGDLDLGPGMIMRNLELPTIAVGPTGNVYVAWNDGSAANSNIRLATSTTGGSSWSLSWATSSANDEVQPAISADGDGLHLAYYQRNDDNTLDVLMGNSSNGGASFNTVRVTTESFPGVFTFPQFDPIVAFGYMGDYIANVSDGKDQYVAWGDNRDTVKNFLWPNGRNDPDVFFARQ